MIIALANTFVPIFAGLLLGYLGRRAVWLLNRWAAAQQVDLLGRWEIVINA